MASPQRRRTNTAAQVSFFYHWSSVWVRPCSDVGHRVWHSLGVSELKKVKTLYSNEKPQSRRFTWALPPASPSQLCALLLSAVNGARRSSAPEGGPGCPPAHLSPFSSGSPASACDGGSFSCTVCWTAPFPPGPPLQQASRKQSRTTTTNKGCQDSGAFR